MMADSGNDSKRALYDLWFRQILCLLASFEL